MHRLKNSHYKSGTLSSNWPGCFKGMAPSRASLGPFGTATENYPRIPCQAKDKIRSFLSKSWRNSRATAALSLHLPNLINPTSSYMCREKSALIK
jgi:hypothetical protein